MESEATRAWLARKLPNVDEPIISHLVYIIEEDQSHWTSSGALQEELGDLLLEYDTVDKLEEGHALCRKMWKDLGMAKLKAAVDAAVGNVLESKRSRRRKEKKDPEWVNCSDGKQLRRGMKIKALYKADNEFYDATFLEPARRSRYRVLFDGYGNEELVTLTGIKIRLHDEEAKEDGPKQLENAVRMSELEENKVKIKTTKRNLDFKQREAQRKLWEDTLRKKEAAEKAGYSAKGSKEAGRISASRTLRLPKVQTYMQQVVAQSLGLGAVSASRKMIELSSGARSEYVQLEASRDILDRVGLRAPDKVSHNIQGDIKINIDLS